MQAAVPTMLGAMGDGPVPLVSPGHLSTALAFSRATGAAATGPDGTWGVASPGLPRFHGAARRLLLEGTRTNHVPNPRAEGAAPGVLPTGWSLSNVPSGITISVLDAVSRGGMTGLRVRIAGTPAASNLPGLTFAPAVAGGVAAGGKGTASIVQALAGGSLTNFGGTNLRATSYDVIALPVAAPAAPDARVAATFSSSAGFSGTTAVSWRIGVTAGAAVDGTFDLFWPQYEIGGVTTPILPPAGAPAAASRAADVASFPLAASAGTIVLRAVMPQSAPPGADAGLLQLDDASDANRVVLRVAAGGASLDARVIGSGSVLATLAAGTMTPGTPFRAALAWSPSGTAACVTGGTVQATAQAPPAGLSRLLLGHGSVALDRALNGEIEFLGLHAARLPDAHLLALANA